MKSLVLVKQVPSADSPFRPNAAGTWIDESNLTYGLNDYDRYALEELLRLKDKGAVSEVVALTIGPERAAPALRTCLATGADRAIHVKDAALEGSDPLSLARVIREAIKNEGFALVLAGLQADDDNYGQIGPLLARLCGMPCATAAMALGLVDGGRVRAQRQLQHHRLHVVALTPPAAITVPTGIHQPRHATLHRVHA